MAEEVLALLALLEPAGTRRPCLNGAEVEREGEMYGLGDKVVCATWDVRARSHFLVCVVVAWFPPRIEERTRRQG
jgi:hypothetical protein